MEEDLIYFFFGSGGGFLAPEVSQRCTVGFLASTDTQQKHPFPHMSTEAKIEQRFPRN